MTKECHTCIHAGWDPDGPYCGHPIAFSISPFGLSFPAMHRESLCVVGSLWRKK